LSRLTRVNAMACQVAYKIAIRRMRCSGISRDRSSLPGVVGAGLPALRAIGPDCKPGHCKARASPRLPARGYPAL